MRVIGSSQFYMIIFLQLLTYFILHYRIVIKFILTDCLGLRNKWSRMNVSDQKHLKTDQNHLKIVKTISIKQGGVDQNYLNNFQLVLVYLTTISSIRDSDNETFIRAHLLPQTETFLQDELIHNIIMKCEICQ